MDSWKPYIRIVYNTSMWKIKMIHILAKHGAKWLPIDRSEIGDARRSLLYMSPDYTVEFIWIMTKYNACKPEALEELIRTPSIQSLISRHRPRINQLIASFSTVDTSTSLPDPQAEEAWLGFNHAIPILNFASARTLSPYSLKILVFDY